MIPSLLLLLLIVPFNKPQQAHKGRNSSPLQIGTAVTVHGGIRLSAEKVRRLFQPGPARAGSESGELFEESERPNVGRPLLARPVSLTESPPMPDPTSPLPSINWQATTGSTPSAAVAGTPPDPQIAVSSTHVVLGMNSGLFFYKKDKYGSPYPSGNNFITTNNLFQPIISSANLGTQANGNIDSFSDLRVIFDPYRKRFWAIATGGFRSQVIDPTTGSCKKDCKGTCLKGAFTLTSLRKRRSVIGLAVSQGEDPAGSWYLYWWDAAPGWGTNNPPYKPGDLADYPSVGVNATTVDITVSIRDGQPCVQPTHS